MTPTASITPTASLVDLSCAELDQHVKDAGSELDRLHAEYHRSHNPHDRDAMVHMREVFEQACRARRARAGDTGFTLLGDARETFAGMGEADRLEMLERGYGT